ncbi:MAG: TlpA family protein disulfide reductase [Cytophagaceae bacterium]|nr:TlpA family protein disulfide reductase [Cytophagaceae bacterium]
MISSVIRFSFLLILLALAQRATAQQVRVVKWPELQTLMSQATDTTYVFNFWATWCKPCLQELPALEALNQAVRGQKVKFLLISMDFVNQLESKVLPLVRSRKLTCPVVLLNETDHNTLIDQIDRSWSGSLPATLIINHQKNRRKLIERPLNFNELRVELTPFL